MLGKIIEWAFTSFNPQEETELLIQLKDSGVEKAMVIKRAPIFGVFISWRLVFITLFAISISFSILKVLGENTLGYVVTSIYALLFLYLTIASVRYLVVYSGIFGPKNLVDTTENLIEKFSRGDRAFSAFFSHGIFIFLVLIAFIILSVGIVFYDRSYFEKWPYLLVILIASIIQFVLIAKYIKRMIDMEMDFNVVVHGKIYFYNQRNLWGKSQMMESEKIKTINSSVSGVFQSFFGYGDILVLSEGDEADNGEMSMFFVLDPKQTVLEMHHLLDGPIEVTIVTVKDLLEKVKTEKEAGELSPETKKDIAAFLEKNDAELKNLYEKGDEEEKEVIKALYVHVEK